MRHISFCLNQLGTQMQHRCNRVCLVATVASALNRTQRFFQRASQGCTFLYVGVDVHRYLLANVQLLSGQSGSRLYWESCATYTRHIGSVGFYSFQEYLRF